MKGAGTKLTYKTHPKSDEKMYVNYSEPKTKARSINAQQSVGKVVLGLVTEEAMKVLHEQPWCGPGHDNITRANKFSQWIKELGPNAVVVSADGSAFDSTQHKEFLDAIDSYFLELVLKNRPNLLNIFDYNMYMTYIKQNTQKIIDSKGMLEYHISGTQMSGRMTTCFGNTLRSACYIHFIQYKMGKTFPFEVFGDDQINFMNKSLLSEYQSVALKYVYAKSDSNAEHGLGQICKIFDVYNDITGAEYLSCYLLYNRKTHNCMLVRKPERFCQLVPYTISNCFQSPDLYYAYSQRLAQEISLCGYIDTIDIDFYSKYYRKCLDLVASEKIIQLKKYHAHRYNKRLIKFLELQKYKQKNSKCNPDERQDFNEIFENMLFDKFNINKNDLNEYYTAINNLQSRSDIITCNLVDKFYTISNSEEFYKVYDKVHTNELIVPGPCIKNISNEYKEADKIKQKFKTQIQKIKEN
jgi:hypothetical protein